MNQEISSDVPNSKPIPFEFFEKQNNKTTKLVDPTQSTVIDGSNRWYDFAFIEPVYLLSITIDSGGYDSWDKFDVEVFHIDGTVHKEAIAVANNTVELTLGKLCQGFRFKPNRKYVAKTLILGVAAIGYSLKEFHSFEWAIKGLQKRESTVALKETELAAATTARDEAKNEVKTLQSQISKISLQKTALDEQILSLTEQAKKGEAEKKDIEREIETFQEERRVVRADIASDRATLTELTTKLRLFPSEIAGFVDQGNRNIKTYLAIGLPFAIILCVVLVTLFSSAIDLTQIWRLEEDVDVWTIFLTRIPFVIVAFALIEACGVIVGRLIFEIVKINRQRLDFAKLSILAKDVTLAATVETDMTDEEKFQKETQLKMGLLQEHMKSYSSEEFRYQGSSIGSAIIGLAGRFGSSKD